MKYLKDLPKERQLRIFPEFLNWLEKEGDVWAAMEVKGLSSVSKNSKPSTTLYSGMGNKPAFKGNCFNCNEGGNRAANCPSNEFSESGQSRKKGGGGRKGRPNQYRKFNCTFCRDDSTWCQTWKCTEL